jgi:hypothetical protein
MIKTISCIILEKTFKEDLMS